VVFFGVVLAAGLGGFALLSALGLEPGESWAVARIVGLAAVVWPAWCAGSLGFAGWRTLAFLLLVVGAVAGAVALWRQRAGWRELATAEAVFLVSTVAVVLLRVDRPEILQTEKPMDFGILNVLVRAEGFPPPDMWLAGLPLPYYYLGALLWATPLALSGLAPEIGYNLIVAMVGGAVAAGLWVLSQGLGASRSGGLLAVAFGVFLGTPDGLRQLLAGAGPATVDLWASSRQIADTITEFPLFTVWLGDLHPHLLSMPLALSALVLGRWSGRGRVSLPGILAAGFLVGCTWAANPWAAPPTALATALLVLCGDEGWRWPMGAEAAPRRWLAAASLPVVALVAALPFVLRFDAPFRGLGLVRQATPPLELLCYAGALLLPCAWLAVREIRGRLAGDGRSGLVLAAAAAVVAAASGRPTLVLLACILVGLLMAVVDPAESPDRAALALAAVGVLLLLVPEVLYVRDPYGDRLHRMNTVFKAYIQAWPLLAVALPVVLRRLQPGRWRRAVVVAVLVVATAPHLVRAAWGPLTGGRPGLDGLRWMDPGDRALVQRLRGEPRGVFLIEAVGDAYSEFGRLSVASGVPAYLGWENHEVVWRGGDIRPELDRRRALITDLYTCADAGRVRALAAQAGVRLVAIGGLERVTYATEGLDAVAAAGEEEAVGGGAVLVHLPPPARGDEG
jgi:YYY domain-containing protein